MDIKYVNYDTACKWIDGILKNEGKIQSIERETLLMVKHMLDRCCEDVVRHGRWELNDQSDNIVYCNQCMMPSDIPTNYCHSCGAKMDLK